jgi:probable rRNA maturation factor
MEIVIQNRQGHRKLALKELQKRIQRILKGLGCAEDCELSVVLTMDQDIAALNEQYLGRQGPTNVLAFPMAEGEFKDLNPGILGDVVVSVETAAREAADNGLDEGEHLVRLLIHGILHLMGYDHLQGREQARRMSSLTEELLGKSYVSRQGG